MTYLRSLIYFSVGLVGLILTQISFYFLQANQVQTSISTIQALLRQETSVSNAFLMSRTLSDLHDSGIIKCVRLTEDFTNRVHFDIRFKDSCGQHPFLLQGKETTTRLQGLNGEWWRIEFESRNGSFFFVSLWLARILITIVCIVSLKAYFHRYDLYEKEQRKTEKFKDLTAQALHDVASPLTLLNALYSSDLTSPEIKDLLGEVKSRMQGIMSSLQNDTKNIEHGGSQSNSITDLADTVSKITKEKQVTYADITWQSHASIEVFADEVELRRVLSNILNNAIEANNKPKLPIKIDLYSDQTQAILSIADKGTGIPEHILPQLGEAALSYGKPSGSGLGLQHAFRCVKSWGGHITISSALNEGTLVTLTFRRA